MAVPAGGMVLGGGLGSIVLMVILVLLGANPKQLMEQAGEASGACTHQSSQGSFARSGCTTEIIRIGRIKGY